MGVALLPGARLAAAPARHPAGGASCGALRPVAAASPAVGPRPVAGRGTPAARLPLRGVVARDQGMAAASPAAGPRLPAGRGTPAALPVSSRHARGPARRGPGPVFAGPHRLRNTGPLAPKSFRLRFAQREDVGKVYELVHELAVYEKLQHEFTGTVAQLEEHMFGPRVFLEVILAEVDGVPAGFGSFFHNYSTFLTKPGLYLEDIFVLPEYRKLGIGKSILLQVAQLAEERGCGRFEWSVLDWNLPSIAFYERMGATVLPQWRICRVTGDELKKMAARIDEP